MKKYLILVCFLFSFFLVDNASAGIGGARTYAKKTPDIKEFHNDMGFSFKFVNSLDNAKELITEFFNKNTIQCHYESFGSYHFIITEYIQEKNINNRKRKTSYLFSINPNEKNGKIDIGITWIVKSCGFREETWRIQDSDLLFKPDTLNSLLNYFKKPKWKKN